MIELYDVSGRWWKRFVTPVGVVSMISAISMISLAPIIASGSPPRHASRQLEGEQVELARSTSQRLFRVRRQERARAEANPANRLGGEIERVAEMLGDEITASVAKGPAPERRGHKRWPGDMRSRAEGGEKESAPHADPGYGARAVKRRLGRAALREQLNALLSQLDSLDSESLRQLPPRQRAVAERARDKARRIESEIRLALEQPDEESQRRLRRIGRRLRPGVGGRASNTRDTDVETPSFRSLTRHRHSRPRMSEPRDRLEEAESSRYEAKREGEE